MYHMVLDAMETVRQGKRILGGGVGYCFMLGPRVVSNELIL